MTAPSSVPNPSISPLGEAVRQLNESLTHSSFSSCQGWSGKIAAGQRYSHSHSSRKGPYGTHD